MKHLFYSLASEEIGLHPRTLPADLRLEIWRPSWTAVTPKGLLKKSFIAWWLFHQLRLFSNAEYGIAVAYEGETPVHYSGIFPKYFRFPFMGSDDLQIGDIWTVGSFRGKGIASIVLNNILCATKKPGRRFWYITEEVNVFSIKLAESAGLKKWGEGYRTKRLGIKLLGAFVIVRQS